MPRKKIVFPTKPRRVRRSTKQGKLRLKELREKRRDRAQWQSKVDISRHHKAGTPINVSNVNGALEYVPRIAIIGGGAGGLVSLRYCLAAGLNATLFEQSEGIGGVWRYDKNISNDFFSLKFFFAFFFPKICCSLTGITVKFIEYLFT